MSLNAKKSVPLYVQLMDAIRSDIKQGNLNQGDQIPSESELSSQYGVSRVTVRNSIAQLVEEGLLIKIQGKGTFVAEAKVERRLKGVKGFTEQAKSLGYEPGAKVVSIEVGSASELDRSFFKLEERSRIISIKRIRYHDNEPVMLETVHFPLKYSFLVEEDLEGSLYSILTEKYNIIPNFGEKSFEICYANTEESKLLDIQKGMAVLLSIDYIYDVEKNPLHITRQVIVAGKYKYIINL